jgi:Cell division protein CrgA
VPKSRVRRKSSAAATGSTGVRPTRKRGSSPPWFGAAIVAMFGLGVLWLVLYYTTSGGVVGQRDLGGWNILVGFGFICAGFGLATQWR